MKSAPESARRFGAAVAVCVALVLAGMAAVPSSRGPSERGGARRLEVRGALDRSVQSHLRRAIEQAEASGAKLVLDIDTPGGDVELMWQMARMIQRASDRGVESIAWVNDQALSAGSLIAMACDLLYMRPTATIGSALPVRIGVEGLESVSEDEAVREKLLSTYRSEFRSIANSRQRPGLLAEAMVDPAIEVVELVVDGERRLVSAREYDDLRERGQQPQFLRTVLPAGQLLNVSGEEAVALGLSDGLATSLDDLANKIGVSSAEITLVQRTRSEDLASVLFTWTPLLLILAFVLAYVELKMPGFGIAGILSAVCFAVVLLGRYLTGLADVPHLLLMVVGVALIATELLVMPGTIWLAAIGAVLLMGGIVWSFAGMGTGFAYALDREILLDESLRVMGAAFLAMLATWALSRFLPKTPFFGRLVLDAGDRGAGAGAMPESAGAHARVARVGARGRALTALRPVGKVTLESDRALDFEARSEGAEIAPGSPVVVLEVTPSGRLVVSEETDAPESPVTR